MTASQEDLGVSYPINGLFDGSHVSSVLRIPSDETGIDPITVDTF